MINKLKKVKIRDVIGIFIFLIVLVPSTIYKIYLKLHKKELWLVCETEKTARDNGYIFYKYLKNKHPEIKSYYAIGFKSLDYNKVRGLGNVIKWGNFKHYFYYMSATKNISSHKEGNPNHSLFTVLHLYLNLYNNRVFLQHGVLYQDYSMFHQNKSKFKIFITGAKDEYDFVCERYGYKNGEVKYTGLARFDNLYGGTVDEKIILLIPTWRRWLNSRGKFVNSKYYKYLNSLINSNKLEDLLEKNNKYLYFYPHLSSQMYIDCYKTKNKRIKILNANNVDIQDLLKKGCLLITDYSSIFTDFSYMHKPVIYYQYDKEEFFNKHYNSNDGKSYFNFLKDGFGHVVETEEDLIEKIKFYVNNNYKVEEKFIKKINKFFILQDQHNCDRIFNEIIGEKND